MLVSFNPTMEMWIIYSAIPCAEFLTNSPILEMYLGHTTWTVCNMWCSFQKHNTKTGSYIEVSIELRQPTIFCTVNLSPLIHLSVIHYTICGVVCLQFTHIPCDDWDNLYTLSYYHHQIVSMNHYPLFRVRSWNNGVRCMSLYILIHISILSSIFVSFKKKKDKSKH